MLLRLDDVCAGYGDLQVLYNVCIHVEEGEVVSLVGSNGAGKTTLLRIISGFVPIRSGSVTFCDRNLMSVKPHRKAELGIAHIPQGRGILGTLTVKENLIMGAYPKKNRATANEKILESYKMFPILEERQNQLAGSLSGGEQQMLAIARALMMNPRLLMLDEPSLGLAPIIVKDMFDIISRVSKQGVSILIVEQNLKQALSVAARGYVLETGKVVMHGPSEELLNNERIQEAYLGI